MIQQYGTMQTSIPDIESLCQYYLTFLYKGIQGKEGFVVKDVCETYGEILYAGINKLLTVIKLAPSDVFMDFGSGLGKAVLQVFINSPVRAAYGIECVPELYSRALACAQQMKQELPLLFHQDRKLDFIWGDFLVEPLDEVTIAFINATCFTQKLLNTLGSRLDNTAGIHTVLSMRPISTLQSFKFIKSVRIQCSWDAALCYIYQR